MSGSLLPMGKKEEEEEDLLTNKPLPRAVEREGDLRSTVTCLSVKGKCSWFFSPFLAPTMTPRVLMTNDHWIERGCEGGR